jgi:hypothetical protein
MTRPGRPRRWCGCADSPYGPTPDWRIWTDQADRAFCASCSLDIRPEQVRWLYALANAEVDRLRSKFPAPRGSATT